MKIYAKWCAICICLSGERLRSFNPFSRGFVTGRSPSLSHFPSSTNPPLLLSSQQLSVSLPASYSSLRRWIGLFVFWPNEAAPGELRSWCPGGGGGRQMARLLGASQWVSSGWAVRKMDGATLICPEKHLLGGKWGIQDATHVVKLPLHWGDTETACQKLHSRTM